MIGPREIRSVKGRRASRFRVDAYFGSRDDPRNGAVTQDKAFILIGIARHRACMIQGLPASFVFHDIRPFESFNNAHAQLHLLLDIE
jgi:hypothetical protein